MCIDLEREIDTEIAIVVLFYAQHFPTAVNYVCRNRNSIILSSVYIHTFTLASAFNEISAVEASSDLQKHASAAAVVRKPFTHKLL